MLGRHAPALTEDACIMVLLPPPPKSTFLCVPPPPPPPNPSPPPRCTQTIPLTGAFAFSVLLGNPPLQLTEVIS